MSDDELNEEKSYSAPALEKGLDILESLAERASAVSLRDLATRLGKSKNEIFRMIHVLIARGYVQRDAETEELSLTNKLFALGLQTPQSRTLLEVALPEMKKLAEEVDQAPHLVVVHKGRTVIIGHIPTNSDVTFNLHLGYGRPASEATTGKVIMAFQTDDKRRLMIGDCERYAGTKIDSDALQNALNEIRNSGHVLGKSTDFVGITDICCPVLDAEGHAVASIIVPHVDRVRENHDHSDVLNAVKRTCERIESRL
ncbi:IclR family transcriptional regulator [Mesorhizobium sp. VK24D]|uniref:IclR family transcriptional regulator n=1 Tax=Mesorhizobium album TaxID=3072314 RepID=A0ABU4Y6K9_9HYPH|nr:IclR family transcriptional regulator [Mesorhizobium sp. VK24D]MDX8482538.1 IclR family transcriptional regulator [Mesorhizobium sp. VK24D]